METSSRTRAKFRMRPLPTGGRVTTSISLQYQPCKQKVRDKVSGLVRAQKLPECRNGNRYLSHPVGPSSDNPKRRRLLMKARALRTTLSGALALALIGGATLASAPASADPVKNAVYRGGGSGGVPSVVYQGVRRRV